MTRAMVVGFGAMVGLLISGQALLGSHGHGGGSHPASGGSHAAKESHAPPKHSGGKPAQHPTPKLTPKAEHKPSTKPKANEPNKQEHTHSSRPSVEAAPNRSNAVGSGSNGQSQTAKQNATTHQDQHHHHLGWHHERWWHGHHHVWSEEGYWVDAGTGLPVATVDGGVAGGGVADVGGPSPAPAAPSAGGRKVQFSVDPSELESFDAAAQAADMTRAEWMRARLNDAVRKELK
jgi:hypothetical protein